MLVDGLRVGARGRERALVTLSPVLLALCGLLLSALGAVVAMLLDGDLMVKT